MSCNMRQGGGGGGKVRGRLEGGGVSAHKTERDGEGGGGGREVGAEKECIEGERWGEREGEG
jgi:hypothetical protein